MGRFGWERAWGEQCCFQVLFGRLVVERPVEVGGVKPGQILVYGALADVDAQGNLSLPEFLFEMEPSNPFSFLMKFLLGGNFDQLS